MMSNHTIINVNKAAHEYKMVTELLNDNSKEIVLSEEMIQAFKKQSLIAKKS